MKRLLESTASDIASMTKAEKLLAIQASEGRTVVAEVTTQGAPDALPNACMGELYAAFGADMLLLNMFDVFNPDIQRADVEGEESIRALKRYTGRLVGLNLEPVPATVDLETEQCVICAGRTATAASARRALELGADYIVLTGNPSTGVTNAEIVRACSEINEAVGDEMIIVAGKMHAAGSLTEAGGNIITKETIDELVKAGANIILLPAPGTVPGITFDYIAELVSYCHAKGVMTLTAIGTSQEDSDPNTIRDIALMCKMAGTDLHHIGDAGHAGCTAESIMAYSIAIRGKRHTYNRMATSAVR